MKLMALHNKLVKKALESDNIDDDMRDAIGRSIKYTQTLKMPDGKLVKHTETLEDRVAGWLKNIEKEEGNR